MSPFNIELIEDQSNVTAGVERGLETQRLFQSPIAIQTISVNRFIEEKCINPFYTHFMKAQSLIDFIYLYELILNTSKL